MQSSVAPCQKGPATCLHRPCLALSRPQSSSQPLHSAANKYLGSQRLTYQLPRSDRIRQQSRLQRCSCTSQGIAKAGRSRRGLIQHKEEAFWFYRFLSIVYDKIVNPGHWTVDMRTDALEPANLNSPNLKVINWPPVRDWSGQILNDIAPCRVLHIIP